MLVTKTGEYALRAVSCLSALYSEAAVSVAELAQLTEVPPSYLSKIMRKLVVAGLVEGQKGHGGGFRLAKEPARISFADVLQAVGAELWEEGCGFGWGRCNAKAPCPLHDQLTALRRELDTWACDSNFGGVVPNALEHLLRHVTRNNQKT